MWFTATTRAWFGLCHKLKAHLTLLSEVGTQPSMDGIEDHKLVRQRHLLPHSGLWELTPSVVSVILGILPPLPPKVAKLFCSVKLLFAALRQRPTNRWYACPEAVATWDVKSCYFGVWEPFHRNETCLFLPLALQPVFHHSFSALPMITPLAVSFPFPVNWWETLAVTRASCNRKKVLTFRKIRAWSVYEGRCTKMKPKEPPWDVVGELGIEGETEWDTGKQKDRGAS